MLVGAEYFPPDNTTLVVNTRPLVTAFVMVFRAQNIAPLQWVLFLTAIIYSLEFEKEPCSSVNLGSWAKETGCLSILVGGNREDTYFCRRKKSMYNPKR